MARINPNKFVYQRNLTIGLVEKRTAILRRKINPLINKAIKEVARAYNGSSGAIYDAMARLAIDMGGVMQDDTQNTIKPSMKATKELFYNTRGKIQVKTAKQDIVKALEDESLQFSVFNFLVDSSKPVAQQEANLATSTLFRELDAIINKGVQEGLSIPEVRDNILKKTKSTSARATLIARTAVANLATDTNLEYAKASSQQAGVITVKRWLPIEGGRTRRSHSAMKSHPAIPLDDYFQVGSSRMLRPLDPNGSAGEVFNCRCTMIYMVRGLA